VADDAQTASFDIGFRAHSKRLRNWSSVSIPGSTWLLAIAATKNPFGAFSEAPIATAPKASKLATAVHPAASHPD
jgi:hypothetical protein